MVRVVTTAVPVLLLCCWCQLGCTKAVAPVASSVTFAVDVSDKHLPRTRRQTTQCEDVVEEKNATTFKGHYQNWTAVRPMNVCKYHCLVNIKCRVAMYTNGNCTFGVSDESSTVTGNATSNTTYLVVVYRCPRHFRCSNFPCKNGATCKTVATEGVGIECVCPAGWNSWFCEEKAEDTGMSNTAKIAIATAIVGVVGLTGIAAIIAVVMATAATAAAGTAAVGGGTAILKDGNVALSKSRDSDSDEESVEESVEEPDDDAAGSIYSLTDSFTNWITGGGYD